MNNELLRFGQDIASNEALRNQFTALGADIDAVVTLARSKGYTFSTQDVRGFASQQGELSDAQLNAVAGGMSFSRGVLCAGDSTTCVLVKGSTVLIW